MCNLNWSTRLERNITSQSASCSRPNVARTSRRARSIRARADSDTIQSFTYNDSDGLGQKATIEHVFVGTRAFTATQPGERDPGWILGWQVNERNLMWHDDLKLRLIKHIAATELGVSDEEMDWRLQHLGNVLPGLDERLVKAPPKLVALLAAQADQVAARLLRLKAAFPQADVGTLVSNRLSLLLEVDAMDVEGGAAWLRDRLPGLNVDKFVELHPMVLDVDSFEMALADAQRIMPGTDVVMLLRRDPDAILSLVKGKHLIEYDAVGNPWA